MIEPMKHQARCAVEFKDRSQLLGHEMGTGKSITAILIHQHVGAVIACPARLKQNWLVELMKMGVEEHEIQIVETAKDELRNAKWVIISYSLVGKFIDRLDFYSRLTCDESHFIKGSSIRSKAIVKLSKKMDVVTLLSGTAIMNKPIELWNQLVCIEADITKEMKRTEFSKRYCDGAMVQMGRYRFWKEDGASNLEELKSKLGDCMDIVKKADVLDLAPKIVEPKIIEFTPDQRREYKEKWKNYLAWLQQNPDHFTEYTKRRKEGGTLNGAGYMVGGEMVNHVVTKEEQFGNVVKSQRLVELLKLQQVTSIAKVDYFLSTLEEIGSQQCIVFTQFIDSIDRLNAGLEKAGVTYSTLKDDGAVEQFQGGQAQVFTANIEAGGQGLNLQNASLAFIIDRHWTPGQNEQAEDRIHRKGQTEQCCIYYVEVADTVDQDVIEANEGKKSVIETLLK